MFTASRISSVAQVAAVAAVAALAASVAGSALAGCSRAAEVPAPQASADHAFDASAETGVREPLATTLVAPPPPPERQSAFSLVARAPTALSMLRPAGDELGNPMPLVQRLPGGGFVVASMFARARGGATGPLSVELHGRGFEKEILDGPVMTQAPEGLRWVWSDDALSVVAMEVETARTGVRLASYKEGPTGFRLLRPHTGYRSAVRRAGAVLALEEVAYEVPDSSMYKKGSPEYQNSWSIKPARVAVLSGNAAAPSIPRGLCPTAMSAAADGSLVIAVDKCITEPQTTSGVLRFAPGAVRATVEWFPGEKEAVDPGPVAVFAASANEIYVQEKNRLETWDGQRWTATAPFADERFASISRSPAGALWAVVQRPDGASRLVKRTRDETAWTDVPLPEAPADRLDPELFEAPFLDRSDFVRVDQPPEEQDIRKPVAGALDPYSVDATEEEVLVLATAEHEAFVLSTHARTPVARLPSIPVQRAQLARTLRRTLATAAAPCAKAFFLVPQVGAELPEGKTVDALRAALAGSSAHLGEGTFEGQRRLVVYGEPENLGGVAKTLAPFVSAPLLRVCGPAVVEKPL